MLAQHLTLKEDRSEKKDGYYEKNKYGYQVRKHIVGEIDLTHEVSLFRLANVLINWTISQWPIGQCRNELLFLTSNEKTFPMKQLMVLVLLFSACAGKQNQLPVFDKAAAEKSIRQLLYTQVAAWNEANIDEFMKGYWKSDSIYFIGSKITSGWDSTMVRYKRSYPNAAAMGKLRFEILMLDFISPDACLVTGKFFLTREKDNPSGIFTLLFRKKNDKWLIVYDHTS
jgi:ketosteroid isomerase-like protein